MKRKIIIALLLIIVTAPFGLIALTIANSKDCKQLVIDTSELHSGIDIPKVEGINCYFDERKNVRLSVYTLKGLFAIDHYLETNDFKRTPTNELNLQIEVPEQEKPREGMVYTASGSKWGHEWRYIIEKESHRLWVELKY